MRTIKCKRFGLMHPTWLRPDCFFYDTEKEARDAIARVYGKDSRHLVVEILIVAENATPAE